ncbi:hypothetical protein BXZ70DRAFT_76860 [Cristinia sonorae]|uniref:C2H2-type domain-containing protein n=1 Tax=Cristinia sonorae TaxID=1940300 RepID=A0A8K0UPX9_9AGAR|nr:hypothetical protein BXZ70DRAFT_76860 [Cristinia sonorae]
MQLSIDDKLSQHMMEVHPKRYRCPECPVLAHTVADLNQHILKRHRGLLPSDWPLCSAARCHLQFTDDNIFKLHMYDIHISKRKCDMCAFVMVPSKYKRHVEIYHDHPHHDRLSPPPDTSCSPVDRELNVQDVRFQDETLGSPYSLIDSPPRSLSPSASILELSNEGLSRCGAKPTQVRPHIQGNRSVRVSHLSRITADPCRNCLRTHFLPKLYYTGPGERQHQLHCLRSANPHEARCRLKEATIILLISSSFFVSPLLTVIPVLGSGALSTS